MIHTTGQTVARSNEQIMLCKPRQLVSRSMREARQGHKGGVFWMTGLSGSGKSTLAHLLEKDFFAAGINAIVLDGDVIRHGLCAGLGFSQADRAENIRRIAELALIFAGQGTVCFCAFITPLAEYREQARAIIGDDYHEIYIDCPLEECERRDVKGYYRLARQGRIREYTGISAPYDVPDTPDLKIETARYSLDECLEQLKTYIFGCINCNKV